MITLSKGKWDGLAALVWVGVVVLFAVLAPVHLWTRLPELFPFVFWTFVWWPPALALAISGLCHGNTAGRICAVTAICSAAVFACFVSFAHVSRAA